MRRQTWWGVPAVNAPTSTNPGRPSGRWNMELPASAASQSSADTLLVELRSLVEHAFSGIASASSASDAQALQSASPSAVTSAAVPLHTLARRDLGDQWRRFRARVSALRQIAYRAIQRRQPPLNRENKGDAEATAATAAAAAVASKLATVSRVHARASASMRSLHAALRRSVNLIDAQVRHFAWAFMLLVMQRSLLVLYSTCALVAFLSLCCPPPPHTHTHRSAIPSPSSSAACATSPRGSV